MSRVSEPSAFPSSGAAQLDPHQPTTEVFGDGDARGATTLLDYEPRLRQALDELGHLKVELAAQRKLETISHYAAGICHEVNTPAQYVTDNVSFLQRAFDKLLKLVEAQGAVIDAVRGAEPTALPLEAADAARRDVKLDYLMRQVPRAVEQSLQGLEQISSIAKALKELSHRSGVEKQPSDLHDLIEGVTVVGRSEWRHVAELELDFDWDLPPVPLVRNDVALALLRSIVEGAQAISAALPQASNHKGRIAIGTKLLGKQAQLRVRCEPRAATSTSNSGALDFTRTVVVDGHGGSVDFEGTPNGGSLLTICLPLGSP